MGVRAASGYPFELLQEIGRGGLGVVYLAYHHRLQKHVVLKRVPTGPLRLDKLRVEVDLLKNLRHSYLPQVYDFIQVGNDVFTVMEHVQGVSLAHYLREGIRPSQAQMITWMCQLGEVLDYLHSCDPPVIHSDIKPDNIMITPRGDVCLIDFSISQGEGSTALLGISDLYASPEQAALAHEVRMGARAGAGQDMWGGAAVSPLQRQGEHSRPMRTARLSPQSDIYSLGATFYWLVLGIQPVQVVCPLPPLEEYAEDYALPYDRAFLRVIDQAVGARGKRITSAVRFLEVLGNLQRLDAHYQWNRRLQWATGATSALLLLVGFLLSLYGWSYMQNAAFQDTLREFRQLVAVGTNDAIVSRGYQVLNDPALRPLFEERPQDKAEVLHTMGDCYFQNDDYAAALPLYAEALDVGKGTQEAAAYYRDYAIALARGGSYDEALVVLWDAEARGVTEASLLLVRAEIAYATASRTGGTRDGQAAFELAFALLARGGNEPELVQRVHILLSQIYRERGDWEASIESLRKANAALPSAVTLRRLADACALYAPMTTREGEKERLLKEARSNYEALCALSAPAPGDRLNLAIVLRSLGEYPTSERMLKDLLAEGLDDYRVAMNLAFLYEMTGKEDDALSFGTYARRAYDNTPAPSREAHDSANIQALDKLLRRLGSREGSDG
ncbi:MAG: protein kinase [Coriobacteriales bacterium]|jgi:serine/threonine protein kinase|nr:protein kinase [Coriobacteriales bacterium]